MVEDEVVDALVDAVSRPISERMSHRYYALKARWLGLEKLQHWDRNAPLPDDADRDRPLGRGAAARAGRLCGLRPEIGAVGQRFFDNAWIDAASRRRASRAAPSRTRRCRPRTLTS